MNDQASRLEETPFSVESDMVEEGTTDTSLTLKAYEAQYRRQDGDVEVKYFNGQRLIEAAQKASDLVSDDPFNTLVSVKELGPIN